MLSAILGIGGGLGIVLSGVILERLDYHWLFWIPLVAVVLAAVATWRFVPESPVRTHGKVNWLAAALMTVGLSAVLLAISQTSSLPRALLRRRPAGAADAGAGHRWARGCPGGCPSLTQPPPRSPLFPSFLT
jgi:uncharacterized membrane protein YfcA